MKHVRTCAILGMLLVPAAPSGAQTHHIPLEGTELFRNILHSSGFRPLETLDGLAEVKPAETLIVLLGHCRVLDDISAKVGGLRKFVNDGGALLVANDGRTELVDFGVRISGRLVRENTGSAYRNIRSCPLIRPGSTNHPLFDAVVTLATNHPSFLEVRENGFAGLVSFSKDTWPEGGRRGNLTFIAGTKNQKRALFVAGHSVFMNMLLAQEDNDNVTFALNCGRWLSKRPDGSKRRYALFVENDQTVTEFDLGLIGPPRIPLPPTEVMNRLLRGLEEEDFFNRLLLDDRVLGREKILRGFIIAVSALVLLYGGWRLIRARQRLETAVPLLDRDALPVSDLSALAERRLALLQQGDFGEAARALARGFFEEYAAAVIPAAGHPVREPSIEARAFWWRRRVLIRDVRYLWTLAYGAVRRVSGRELSRLPHVLDVTAAGLHTGTLILEPKE